jgi:hypothetical protein
MSKSHSNHVLPLSDTSLEVLARSGKFLGDFGASYGTTPQNQLSDFSSVSSEEIFLEGASVSLGTSFIRVDCG